MIYLGTAPKSNAAYVAFGAAKRAAKETGSLMPPMHILNAPTKLMKERGYGKGYDYDHNEAEASPARTTSPTAWSGSASTSRRPTASRRELKERLERLAELAQDARKR